jgi:transposase
MDQYVGLDVSQDITHVCVVDRDGNKVWEGSCESTPEAIGVTVEKYAPSAVKIGLESGHLSTWHWHGLNDMGLPAICIDAYHAHGVLRLQLNKTHKNDASGIAQIMRCGWYKEVLIKSFENHESRALFRTRSNLVSMRTDVVNQIRGMLKTFGILFKGIAGVGFETRVQEIIDEGSALAAPLQVQLDILRMIKQKINDLDEFVLAVYDADRFKQSKSVGAYFGLTPRRRQSGEMDYNGRISKRGDRVIRHQLYEAANAILTRVKKPSSLQAWGLRIAKRSGLKKARIAVARKLAVIMHQMLQTGELFCFNHATGERAIYA